MALRQVTLCGNASLTGLESFGLAALKNFMLSHLHKLLYISFKNVEALKTFRCDTDNALVDLDLSGCKAREMLTLLCTNNSCLTSLRLIDCGHLCDFDRGGCDMLGHFHVG